MAYYFYPNNDNLFDIDSAIKENDGTVDIRCDELEIGDKVFVYKSKPNNHIRYMMEVIAVGINDDKSISTEKYWKDLDLYFQNYGNNIYVRLKLIKTFEEDTITKAVLQSYGMTEPFNVLKIIDDSIAGQIIERQIPNDNSDGVSYSNDSDYYEGAMETVKMNRYERDRKAREECVRLKGCKCAVCGCDFEENYGKVGKGFIHIHHVVPISSIGKVYKLDVRKDLVPVCPNCHYMLHHKIDGVYTVEELRQICAKRTESQTELEKLYPILKYVESDDRVKNYIDTSLSLSEGTSLLKIQTGCIDNFGEYYPGMSIKDWYKAISSYVKMKTNIYELKPEDTFKWMAAETEITNSKTQKKE